MPMLQRVARSDMAFTDRLMTLQFARKSELFEISVLIIYAIHPSISPISHSLPSFNNHTCNEQQHHQIITIMHRPPHYHTSPTACIPLPINRNQRHTKPYIILTSVPNYVKRIYNITRTHHASPPSCLRRVTSSRRARRYRISPGRRINGVTTAKKIPSFV
jgi:hypothetical protein